MGRTASKTRAHAKSTRGQRLRITGGEWRGRRFSCTDSEGLRPTLAQNRERLGNWLQYRLAGRVLLDGFAGSGMLGLEGLSRGAAWCDWVEASPQVAVALRQALVGLGDIVTERGRVYQQDFMTFLQNSPRGYDGVYLDPPFGADLTAEALAALARADCLNPGAWVYVEMSASEPPPPVPPELTLDRESTKGQVRQWLLVHLDGGSVESTQGSR